MFWVGVDVGGTFTDGVVWDDQAQLLSYAKAPSTPGNPTKGVIDVIEHTSIQLENTTQRMPSGAGHDAQMLARVCPAAMIFVPSVNGISHNAAEHTDADDLVAGANILLQSMITLCATDFAKV